MTADTNQNLMDKVKRAPKNPGCYLFYDKSGYVIYVGKAKNLSSRVRSYFINSSRNDARISNLVAQINDVEYVLVESELDALLYEYYLIKKYKPWFNSQLKPDKIRPYLRISADKPYGTITIAETECDDGAQYFDFFIDGYDADYYIAVIGKVWGLPQCKKRSFQKKDSPCPYKTIDNCMAPCSHIPDEREYEDALCRATAFLNGDNTFIEQLNTEMLLYSDRHEFEKAARSKKLLDELSRLQNKSRRRFHIPDKGAFLVLIRPYRERMFSAFYILDGIVCSRRDFTGEENAATFREYAHSLRANRDDSDNKEWLLRCLAEVIARKEVIRIPDGSYIRCVTSTMRRFVNS